MTRRALTVCAVLAILGASASAVQASTASDHRGISCAWGAGSHPALDKGSAFLLSVTAVSTDDVWAVGVETIHGPVATLIEHWDGASWSVVPSPNPVGVVAFLYDVDAISSDNVWAVGCSQRRPWSPSRSLIEHWNGTRWHRVPSPNPSTTGSGTHLSGVSAVSAGDVWAVGFLDPPDAISRSVAMRWNGDSWSAVRTPDPPVAVRGLDGVSALNSSSGWAVGYTVTRDLPRVRPLVEHWNGRRWNQAPIASPGACASLTSVTVVGPGNVWAVGNYDNGDGTSRPLVEHRSAGQWSQVRPPGLGWAGTLTSVSGAGPDDVWAVGTVRDAAVLAHWDGDHWSLFHGPGSSTARPLGVTAHGTATWAVGQRVREFRSLKEHWNGRSWTQ